MSAVERHTRVKKKELVFSILGTGRITGFSAVPVV